MTNDIIIDAINPFSINANKLNVTKTSPTRLSAPHIHDLCEIYVNITGNVSFMVEKNIYSIEPGDIIITKPYEYHHCIYHDDSDHLHYWIMFSPHENPKLFDFFLERERGTGNHIRLTEERLENFLSLCERITRVNPAHRVSAVAAFFDIISCIARGHEKYNVQDVNKNLPQNVNDILNYINKNYSSIKNINQIASTFHISITTLERYFKKHLSITPRRYLEDKKLTHACMLLRQNFSVTDACFESGFDDYSHFIMIFKNRFSTTPLKYKKTILNP